MVVHLLCVVVLWSVSFGSVSASKMLEAAAVVNGNSFLTLNVLTLGHFLHTCMLNSGGVLC